MFKKLCVAACAVTMAASAHAQNMQLSQSSPTITSVNVNSINAMLERNGFTGVLQGQFEDAGKKASIIEASSGNSVFYIALRECDGEGVTAPCSLVEYFAFFVANGLTVAQINTFNLNEPRASFAGLMGDGRGIIGGKSWLNYGVDERNVEFNIGLFLGDIDLILGAVSPASLTSADGAAGFKAATATAFDPGAAFDVDWKINNFGLDNPSFMTSEIRATLEAAGL